MTSQIVSNKSSIFEHSSSRFVQEIQDKLGRGKVHALLLYKHWFKSGKIVRELPAFANAQALLDEMLQIIDFSHAPCHFQKCEGELTKFLLKTHDGYDIETVRLPMKSQETLCVSSQVGCRMGCHFCETGRMGLLRDLSVPEIVSQVFVARHLLNYPIRNVVFMGMGEPFDNYDNVMQAIDIMTDQNGFAMGMHRITVSTSGRVDGILRLAREEKCFPNLAVSINAPSDEIRTKLMPHNRKDDMQALYDAMKEYIHATGKQILIAYVLIHDVTDKLEYAPMLWDYLQGLNVKINLIPYNPQSNDRFQAPLEGGLNAFASALRQLGAQVLIRKTKGASIMAACGQLGNVEKRQDKALSRFSSF